MQRDVSRYGFLLLAMSKDCGHESESETSGLSTSLAPKSEVGNYKL